MSVSFGARLPTKCRHRLCARNAVCTAELCGLISATAWLGSIEQSPRLYTRRIGYGGASGHHARLLSLLSCLTIEGT